MYGIQLTKSTIGIFLLISLFTISSTAHGETSLTGHYAEGTTNAVFVRNGCLYTASGCILKLYDITDISVIPLLNWQTIPTGILYVGTQIQGFDSDEDYFYIATRERFLIVDDSDQSNPVIIGSYDLPFNSDFAFRHAEIQGQYAYLLKAGYGMTVLDISVPSNPSLAGEWHAPATGDCWELNITGDCVYLGMAGYLYIIDVSDPSLPELVNTLDFYPNVVSSIAFRNSIAFIVEYHWGLWSFDISDPFYPVVLDSIRGENDPNASRVRLFGDHAYLSTRYEGFRIFDITDPSNLDLVGVSDSNHVLGYSENLFPIEEHVFTTEYTEGVQAWSTSDITQPEYLSIINMLGEVRCIKAVGNYLYIAPRNGGIWIVDISNPSDPVTAGYADETHGRYYSIAHSGNYIYIVGAWGGLNIFDISDPTSPSVTVEDWGLDGYGSQPTTLLVEGNTAYYHVEDTGLRIVDISDPYNPSLVVQTDIPDYGTAKSVDCLIVCSDDVFGLCTIDVSDSSTPQIIGSYPHDLTDRPIAITGNNVFVGRENCFQSFDISDPTSPEVLDTLFYTDWSLEGADISIHQDRAYCTGDYLKVFDISDPEQLVLEEDITELPMSNPHGMITLFSDGDIQEGYWYVGAGDCGVFIFSISQTGIDEENSVGFDHCLRVSPNPFQENLNIQWRDPSNVILAEEIRLGIYDISGRLIREWNNPDFLLSEGIAWNGEDQTGGSVPAGIYFVRVTLDNCTKTEKVLFLR